MRRNRKTVYLLSILCVLLWGMCFDSIGADSFSMCASSHGLESDMPALHSLRRSLPSKAYVPKKLSYGERVLSLSQTPRRNLNRPGRSLALAALLTAFCSPQPAFLRPADACMDFHEIRSNIVIISYIHNQDGKKA